MTSNDRSAWAQIVLNIHEGHGLGTNNLPLVIVANLNKNRLESDVIHPFSTKLEVEFVWEGEMKEVKRLKQANTSIKVECFSVLNTQRREKMGYVVLSLRQAVLIPRDKKNSTVESWHKLMGVKPEMKKSEPKLLITLSLQEKPEQTEIKNIIADTPVEKEGKEEISPLISEKKTIEAPAPKSDKPTSSLQSEVIMETNRNVTMDKEEVKYGPITGKEDNCNRGIHHYSLRISFEYVKFTTPPAIERIYIRVNHKSAEVLCTGCDEIDVSNISDVEAELRLKASADQINSLLMGDSPQVQLYDATGVVASAILDLGGVSTKTEPKSYESDLICHKTKQKIGVLAARLSLRDCGVLLQQARYENDTETQPMKNMTFDRSVAERIVEELEDWKERQQQLFLVELKKKESDHLARLTAESIKRRKEMEDNLYENVNKYEAMAAALNEANEKIKEVALQNEDKARQLKLEEDDLHRKFNSKLQELREASKRMEADVNHKLNMASTERNELVDKLNHLLKAEKRSEKVRSALEEEIENLRMRTVTKEEFEKVTQTLKNVEVSLNSALESKAFYKSQWGKAVREIHRLKKELQDAMDQQLQRERLEVFKMKLSQQAIEQEKELVTDRLVLTNLQKETQDFIMKKCSTYS